MFAALRLVRPFDYGEASLDVLYGRIRKSDAQAFEALFERLREPLFRYIARLLPDADAYDVLQDVFLKLWDTRRQQDIRVGVRPFLYRAARNRALNVLRKMRRLDFTDELPEPEIEGGEPSEIDSQDLAERIGSWIEGLPPRRAEAFMLSRYHELSHTQIARIMGLSPRTVQTHMVHALRDLRAELQRWEERDRIVS